MSVRIIEKNPIEKSLLIISRHLISEIINFLYLKNSHVKHNIGISVNMWKTNERVVFIPIEVANKYNEKKLWMVAIYEKAITYRNTVIPVIDNDDDVFIHFKKMEKSNNENIVENENIEENQVNDLIKTLLNENNS